MCGLLGICLLFGQESADGLGGVLERGILGVNLDLRYNRSHVPTLVRLVHSSTNCLLQVVTNVTLAHSATLGKIHGRDRRVGLVGIGECLLNHADLRAVTVGNDDLVTLLDDLQQNGSCVTNALDLLFWGIT